MNNQTIHRRRLLQIAGISTGAALLPFSGGAKPKPQPKSSFTYCLNMATIRGHNLGFIKELEVAASAGFKAVELWIDSLQTYLAHGGTIADAKKRIDDLGLQVENAIAFAEWMVEDETLRRKGLEQMKREMELFAGLGCKRIAATAMGADKPIELKKIAEWYRAILQISDETGVVPQLEMWGFSNNLTQVSDVLYIALESGHPSAKVLLDVFHLYKGGSSLNTLPLVGKPAIDIFHMNDYPATIPVATITDADRIYPGDGVAPLHRILQILQNPQQPVVLSLEVFNKNYYRQNALDVAKTGLAKMKAVAEAV